MNSTGATDRSSYPVPHRFTESVDYSDSVEARGNFVSKGKSPGNENRRWHGTQRKCNIGDKGVTNFCTDSGCSLCCILKTSFDIRFVGRATDRGIYGAGIYTSSTPPKFVFDPNECNSGSHLTLWFRLSGLIPIRVMLVSLLNGRRSC